MIKEWELKELKVDQKLEPMVKPPITKVQLAQYAGASGDFNPLHLDDDFAQKIGMDGVVAHGMLVMGFLGEYVMKIAGKEARVANFKMRFGKMTVPGDEIRCSGVVERTYEEDGKRWIALDLTAEKVSGEVVGSGSAILQLT
ncbi:dehydratase [Sporosarcina sp. P21c]|uniref:MaoC/PaaZ C-terminal domain-containing protein n=1 Tax=Sporosarcina TaxID=1569 RepID=UPI000A1477A5|nr:MULTISPECIES: MaoC/PaaZ C-terminal domain-containing protein [Sporosarcina]ARJ37561.1 dehydratase [Sporosarcina ureae]PIC67143.1 dehydratase [Sporosarcina sp. P16a]PIC82736.1 dehydratase [Sporosarcina sp. P1]PIC89563.1 dehydratase [Sporosarcina sp. P21c]PIC92595.1 dehydratase [Sporosarcina sp. P25]